jgi:hypothetical protein
MIVVAVETVADVAEITVVAEAEGDNEFENVAMILNIGPHTIFKFSN